MKVFQRSETTRENNKSAKSDVFNVKKALKHNYSVFLSWLSVESFTKTNQVLGSGCYRIGASVEFDWSSVSAVRTLRETGHRAMATWMATLKTTYLSGGHI